MKLKSNSKIMNKYLICTDKGNTYYVIKRIVEVEDKDDIKYLEARGYTSQEVKVKNKKVMKNGL